MWRGSGTGQRRARVQSQQHYHRMRAVLLLACKHVPIYGSLENVEQGSAGNLSLLKSSVCLNILRLYWKKFTAHMLKTAGVSSLHLMLTDWRLFTEQQEKRNSQQSKIHNSERAYAHARAWFSCIPAFICSRAALEAAACHAVAG